MKEKKPSKSFETDIEKLLRIELESRGLKNGLDFVCQFPIRYSFILDFAFPEQKICIEADGEPWHNPKKDAIKTNILKREGWKVFRFKGSEIYEDPKKCIDEVFEVRCGKAR